MFGVGRTIAVVIALAAAPVALAASGDAHQTGTWQRLAAAPVAPNAGIATVWTGRRLFLFGRVESHDKTGAVTGRAAVAALYDPRTGDWRKVARPPASTGFADAAAFWTGREVLVWGQGTRLAFNPVTGRWRRLPSSRLLAVHDGFRVMAWTGRELIGWGGGCCGDAFDDGVAYSPATNRWRALPRAPLTPGGSTGAWTGRELVVISANASPDGKPYPARLARAAAYDPAANTWRRVPTPPSLGGTAVWTGSELLLVGAGADSRALLSYVPDANRWWRLSALPSGRFGSAVAWTGTKLLVWGGYESAAADGYPAVPPHGLLYEPSTGKWSPLPQAPLAGRYRPAGAWTGHSLIVWGGTNPARPLGTGTLSYTDGALYTPPPPVIHSGGWGCGGG
jgi:hypothetical protein